MENKLGLEYNQSYYEAYDIGNSKVSYEHCQEMCIRDRFHDMGNGYDARWKRKKISPEECCTQEKRKFSSFCGFPEIFCWMSFTVCLYVPR